MMLVFKARLSPGKIGRFLPEISPHSSQRLCYNLFLIGICPIILRQFKSLMNINLSPTQVQERRSKPRMDCSYPAIVQGRDADRSQIPSGGPPDQSQRERVMPGSELGVPTWKRHVCAFPVVTHRATGQGQGASGRRARGNRPLRAV